jgi:hypothetical protein
VSDRTRSNSFSYVHEGTQGVLSGKGCPVRADGVTPWDRARILFLREGDQVERYRTESRDFTDVEIGRAKLDLGQVYDDVSSKAAPDDFARDLASLRRSDLCDPCDAKATCGGLWERVYEDVFTRDDAARAHKVLSGLPLELLERRDVGPGSSNQWLLVYRRA